MADALTIAIKAVNESQAALSAAHQDVTKLGTAAKDAHPHMSTAGDKAQEMGSKAASAHSGVSGLSTQVDGLSSHLSTLAPALAGIGAAFAGAFAIKGAIGAATELGGELNKMSREMGLTAEQASVLHFQFQETGVSFESGEKSLVKFAKGLAGLADSEDLTFKVGKALQENIKSMGIEFEGVGGKARPVSDILVDIAEKFKSMPNGMEKTALAVQLFGKSGAELIPFLNKGKDGLADFAEEAKKFGLVLDGPTLEALKKQKAAQREFSAALEGIKVQIGVQLIPVMVFFAEKATELAVVFNEHVVPAIKAVAEWISKNIVPAVKEFITLDLIPKVKEFAAVFKDQFLPVIKELGEIIKDKVQGPFERLVDLLGGKKDVFKDFAVIVGSVLVVAFTLWAVSAGAAAVATLLALAPVILIGAAIGVVVLAIFELIKHWGDLEKKYPPLQAATDAARATFAALGSYFTGTLIPAASSLASWFMDNILPALQTIASTIVEKVIPAGIAIAGNILGVVVPAAQAFAGWFGDHIVPLLQAMWAIIQDDIIPALTAMAGFVVGTVIPNFVALATWITAHGIPVLQTLWNKFTDDIIPILITVAGFVGDLVTAWVDFATKILEKVPEIVTAIGKIATKAMDIVGDVQDALEKIPPFFQSLWNGVSGPLNSLLGALDKVAGAIGRITSISGAIGGVASHIPGFASGTNYAPGGWTMVGEAGPELVQLPRGAIVKNASESQAMMGGGGGDSGTTINVTIQGSVYGVDDLLYQLDRALKRVGQAGLVA